MVSGIFRDRSRLNSFSVSLLAKVFIIYKIVTHSVNNVKRYYGSLQDNPFDFIQGGFLCPPVVEFCGSRGGVACHVLRVFELAIVLQISRDPCGPEGMVCKTISKTGGLTAPFYHRQGFSAIKPPVGEPASVPGHGPKNRPIFFFQGGHVGFHVLDGRVVCGHDMVASPFFLKPEIHPASDLIVVSYIQSTDSRYPGKGVDHDPNEGLVA